MATRLVVPRDNTSPENNQAHANQMIDMSGAVETLASLLAVRVSGIEIPARPPQPRNQRRRTSARSNSVAGDIRLARLCVLIEPNPARRAVHQDLGRILHPL
ncbi:MAG: hypothetical protein WB561_22260 [Terracidiphilus sp.]